MIPRTALTLFAVTLCGCLSTASAAQSGYSSHDCTVGDGFACEGVRARETRGSDPHDWIRVLVLWKGGETSGSRMAALRPTRDTATAREFYRRFVNAQRAAQDLDRAFMGGISGDGYWIASYSWMRMPPAPDSLFILDQAFELPGPDTALVVLVDSVHTLTHTPQIISALRIANRMPTQGREKIWTSGDTTFIVRPRDTGGSVPDSILEHPAVREYLARAP